MEAYQDCFCCDKTRENHPVCPECCGEGVVEVFVHGTGDRTRPEMCQRCIGNGYLHVADLSVPEALAEIEASCHYPKYNQLVADLKAHVFAVSGERAA